MCEVRSDDAQLALSDLREVTGQDIGHFHLGQNTRDANLTLMSQKRPLLLSAHPLVVARVFPKVTKIHSG